MKPNCFLCRVRPAKPLTPKRGRDVYKEGVVTFCSLTCAANAALLFLPSQHWHFCPNSKDWEPIGEIECDHCDEWGK